MIILLSANRGLQVSYRYFESFYLPRASFAGGLRTSCRRVQPGESFGYRLSARTATLGCLLRRRRAKAQGNSIPKVPQAPQHGRHSSRGPSVVGHRLAGLEDQVDKENTQNSGVVLSRYALNSC